MIDYQKDNLSVYAVYAFSKNYFTHFIAKTVLSPHLSPNTREHGTEKSRNDQVFRDFILILTFSKVEVRLHWEKLK